MLHRIARNGLSKTRRNLLSHRAVRVDRRRTYISSSFGAENPKIPWLLDSQLSQHVRLSLKRVEVEDKALGQLDTGLSVTFLGTGAGSPSPERSNSATIVRMGSTSFLIDAGEGVQRQLQLSRINMGDIRKIFVTHMHGDHIFGLPGLLLGLQIIAKMSPSGKKHLVQVYGPVGLYNYIAASLSLSCTELNKLNVEIYELHVASGRDEPQPWRHPAALRQYPEFRHRSLRRKFIPQNQDGTWTLSVADEVETPEQALDMASQPRGVYVRAAQLDHLPKLQCFGYTIEEPRTLPGSIDPQRALELGVKPGQKYKLLKSGFPVMTDDGSRQVSPDEVLVEKRSRPRKVTILGDCFAVSFPMAELSRDSDVLVHEATCFDHEREKLNFGGHSSAAMAGRYADLVKPQVLVLNHLSATTYGKEPLQMLIDEAKAEMQRRIPIQAAFDHLELLVPRGGFAFAENHRPVVSHDERLAQSSR